MKCKKCGIESVYIDETLGLCANCIDKDFLDWIEEKYKEDK